MKRERLQTASPAALPPRQESLFDDPLVVANTRFSPDRRHRYTLFRHWGAPEAWCAFIGMNPSGADEVALDRTVLRCRTFAERWGFGAFYMLNAFALRSTDSQELYRNPDPVGPDNDRWICEIAGRAARVVVAWGKPGRHLDRDARVTALLREACRPDRVFCFGRNQDGTPVHPLYQPYDRELVPFL